MKRQIDYVTVISTGYLKPILKLFEAFKSSEDDNPNEVQVSATENSFAASAIILTITMLESAIRRTQYCRKETNEFNIIKYLRKTFPDYEYLDGIEEIIVLRDALVHNHIWEATIYGDDDGQLKLSDAKRDENFGDGKYDKVLDLPNRCTRLLRLNLFPTKVGKSDAVIVFKNAIHFLNHLESIDHRYVYITNEFVEYSGKLMNIMDILKIL